MNFKFGFKYYTKVVRAHDTTAVVQSFKNQGWNLDSRRVQDKGIVSLTFSKKEGSEEEAPVTYNRFDRLMNWDPTLEEPKSPAPSSAPAYDLEAFLRALDPVMNTQDAMAYLGLDFNEERARMEQDILRAQEIRQMQTRARANVRQQELDRHWEVTEAELATWVRQSRDRSHNQ